jgi:AcrR family transcriptional regulator
MARVGTARSGRARALVPEDSLSPGDADEVMDSCEARERILDAAEDLFAADGFDATPTARIARRAAVAKGLLFY